MNARQLEVFRAIMRSGTLTAAAQFLNVSQPAVSKILRHLESQLGYRLFERAGGRLHPTAEAQLLFADADRVFREIETVRDLAIRIRERRVGLLRIGASAPPSFAVLPAALTAFQARHPGVKVLLRTLSAEELSEKILVGEVDLGLTLSAIRVPMVQAELLTTAAVVALIPAASPLARRAAIEPADLEGERLISYGSHADVGPLLDAAFERAGLSRQVHVEVATAIAALPLVQAGLGVGLVDGMLPWAEFPGVVARPFLPRVLMSLSLVTSGTRPASRFVRDIAEDIRAAIGGAGDATAPSGRSRSRRP
ncbi:LysR substrate-binding domain-containing protein [Roseomonas sp. E05]|uniref:LysR substrate-binding domain-containing protein n=1 Tax=Roseomonas sp. E05 TaxID=3046310 RepID=UPI0024B9EE7F|nr:LysR substrate-binding domain-containing protein [Roseomonas sp. E05]MDJ0389069.1 LysR substrate-binding domain-containing protein [Roseomonas sp. E05]